MLFLLLQLPHLLLFLIFESTSCNSKPIEDPYPHNKSRVHGNNVYRCQYSALRLGTKIADLINALPDEYDTSERIHQDFIIENLGFSPWISEGLAGGKSFSGASAKELHRKGGWIDQPIEKSPYNILNNQWVYFFGDSILRQVWASFAAPFQTNNFERNAKEWTRQNCNPQFPHRAKHEPFKIWCLKMKDGKGIVVLMMRPAMLVVLVRKVN